MKFYITKYALTEGIFEVEAEPCEDNPKMIRVPGRYAAFFHGEGRDWHRTFESARDRAEAMRVKKRESLRRSMAKLNKFDFSKLGKP